MVADIIEGSRPWSTNFAIAGAKVVLVALFFMHLRRDRPIVWLVAAAGLAWLSLLAGLSLADFALRLG